MSKEELTKIVAALEYCKSNNFIVCDKCPLFTEATYCDLTGLILPYLNLLLSGGIIDE